MKLIYSVLSGVTVLGLACAPTPSQVQKILEDNPDVLVAAFKKNPDKIIEGLNEAAQAAQGTARQREVENESKKREEEFTSPKQAKISDARAIRGPKDAKVTIVEYSDFQCPFCSRGFQTVEKVMDEYKGKVKLIYKHLPLDFHPMAMPAAKRFEAIALQSPEKAYKFHDEIFRNQGNLKDNGEKWMDSVAQKLGIDMAQYKKDITGEKVKAIIDEDMAEAQSFGFSGTPGFLVGGVSLKGAYPVEEFKKIIDRWLAK